MTRLERAISHVASNDPQWLLQRMAEVARRQKEHDERTRTAESRLAGLRQQAPTGPRSRFTR